MFSIYSIYRFFIPYYPYVDPDMLKDTSAILTVLGGVQLLDLIITELKRHDLLKTQGLSLMEILFVKKNPLQDLLSSLNAGISTNERH